MRLGRALWISAGAAICGALGLAGFAFWILATEPGAVWLTGRLVASRAPWVSIDELHGSLWEGLTASGVVVVVGSSETRIDSVALHFDFSELFSGTVELSDFAISAASYRRAPAAADAVRRPPPDIPLRIVARDASVEELVVTRGTDSVTLGPLVFSLTAQGNRIVFDALSMTGPDFSLTANARLELGAGIAADGELDWTLERQDVSYAGTADFEGLWPAFEVHHRLSAPVAADAEGEIRLGPSPRADLVWTWADLAWPESDRVASTGGRLQITGWLEEFSFDANGRVVVDGIAANVEATGSGTPTALDFDVLEIASDSGDIAATGELRLEPLALSLEIDAENLDPSVRYPAWPGSLALTGTLSGNLEPLLQLGLTDVQVIGVLRDETLEARGGLAYSQGNEWRLDGVNVDVSGNRVSVSGNYGRTLALDFSIEAPSVQMLWPDAAGSLRANGRLGGTPEAPELSGTVQGQNLGYGDYRLASLSLSGDLASRDNAPVMLDLAAQDLVWREISVQSIAATIAGSSENHVAELAFESEHGTGRLSAQGSWLDRRWTGQARSLSLEQPALGIWSLEAPTALVIGPEELRVDPACIRKASSGLCGSARIGTDDDRVELSLDGFDLANLSVFLPPEISLAGAYDARIVVEEPLGRPTGTLSLSGASTLITVREPDAPPIEFPLEEVDLGVELLESGSLAAQASLVGSAGARFAVDAEIPDLWAADPQVGARITALWTDLGMLALVSPDVGEVSGAANLDLALSGRLRAPEIRGQARWSGGGLAVPRWGFIVEGIDAQASSPDGERVLLEATGRVGEGRLDIEGAMDLDPSAGWPTRLTVRGDTLQAVRLPDAQIIVASELDVRAALPMIEVSGSVRIPRARLEIEEIPAQAASPSTDTVVHGADQPERRRPLNVHAELDVMLGDDVRYSGAGLDVALTGGLDLVYDSGRNAVATGSVNLSGEYAAYGQRLALDQGQLLFAGPINNPGLDVRATRLIETTTVGVELGGTLNAPTTRIFSEPAMSEADALAYLLLGRPLAGSGDEETATLESAAVSMGLRQALPVIQRVGQTLGLDELSVQTTAADTGELMAGKQLSPRLYMRYTYGLFNRIGGLLLRFSLNERLSLETRSGDNRSMDLIYTVERDRQ